MRASVERIDLVWCCSALSPTSSCTLRTLAIATLDKDFDKFVLGDKIDPGPVELADDLEEDDDFDRDDWFLDLIGGSPLETDIGLIML